MQLLQPCRGQLVTGECVAGGAPRIRACSAPQTKVTNRSSRARASSSVDRHARDHVRRHVAREDGELEQPFSIVRRQGLQSILYRAFGASGFEQRAERQRGAEVVFTRMTAEGFADDFQDERRSAKSRTRSWSRCTGRP